MYAKKESRFWYGHLKGDKRQTAARTAKLLGSFRDGTVLMPIQKTPLRVFRTFICIKRIPPPPLFYFVHPLSTPCSCLLACSLPRRRLLPSTSAIWKHFHFLFSPPFYISVQRTRCFAFIRPSAPLHCTFQPSSPRTSALLRHMLLIYPLCFSEELEYLLHARISLLNLVLQDTILLLSPFSPRYFSCRYSTLLLFLVNAFVFVTGTSPLFFCMLGFHSFVCFYFSLPFTFYLLFYISAFICQYRFYYPLILSLLMRAMWLLFYLSRFVYCHLTLNIAYPILFPILLPASPYFNSVSLSVLTFIPLMTLISQILTFRIFYAP